MEYAGHRLRRLQQRHGAGGGVRGPVQEGAADQRGDLRGPSLSRRTLPIHGIDCVY